MVLACRVRPVLAIIFSHKEAQKSQPAFLVSGLHRKSRLTNEAIRFCHTAACTFRSFEFDWLCAVPNYNNLRRSDVTSYWCPCKHPEYRCSASRRDGWCGRFLCDQFESQPSLSCDFGWHASVDRG